MKLVEFKNVSLGYGGINIIEDVNFDINTGDYIYIVGENGSGKTTLLKGLLGLKKETKGSIVFEESLSRKEIGYIPQQKDIKRDFPASVYEIVISGRLNNKKNRLFYSREDKDLVIENLKKLDILDLKNKPYRFLSGGQQQRVLLARALCATGKILILDEPDTGLDPEAKKDLYSMLEEINRRDKITIVMVTHDIRRDVRKKNSRVFRVENKSVEIYKELGDVND